VRRFSATVLNEATETPSSADRRLGVVHFISLEINERCFANAWINCTSNYRGDRFRSGIGSAGVNVLFADDTDVGLMLGIGYNF
jgi:hypothetical protein